MGAQTELTQRTNAATPLSEDVIGLLRNQIAGGDFGAGVGPLQREAGTAMRQFVDALNRRVTGQQDMQGGQFDAVREIQRQNRQESLADVREGFGAAGNITGSGVGFAQSQVLRDMIPRQERALAQIRREEEDALMRSIMGMGQMGSEFISPFLSMAGQGILDPAVTQQEHPFMTLLGGLAGGAAGAGNLIRGLNTGVQATT